MSSIKNFILLTILVFVLGAVIQPFTPWWTVVIAAGIPTLFFKNKAAANFSAGFLGIGLLWMVYAGWIDRGNEGILSTQVGQIFNGLSSFGLLLSTAAMGGIVGGFAAMTAGMGKALISPVT